MFENTMSKKISFSQTFLQEDYKNESVPSKLTIIPKPNKEGFLNLTEEESKFRKIKVGNLEEIITKSYKAKDKFPIDVAHQSEYSFTGRESRSYGYFYNLRVEEGAIVASCEWNKEGLEVIKEKEFLYLSPAFTNKVIIEEGEDPHHLITRITSIALTNSPAQEQKSFLNESSEDAINLKIKQKMTKKIENPDLEEKVSKVTEQIQILAETINEVSKQNKQLLESLKESNKNLKEADASKEDNFQEEVKTYLESKSKEGVISKAEEQCYKDLCSSEGNFESVKNIIDKKTKQGLQTESSFTGKDTEIEKTTLSDEQEVLFLNSVGNGFFEDDQEGREKWLKKFKESAEKVGTIK